MNSLLPSCHVSQFSSQYFTRGFTPPACSDHVTRYRSTMAASVANYSSLEIHSFVRGYHAYMDIWKPSVGDCLFLMPEPDNIKDENAVAIILHDKTVVGHVPFHLAPLFSQFLKRNFNKGMVKVTGDRVNRGAGYGLVYIRCYVHHNAREHPAND